jgi:ABC-type bacteriocin/lantibiotic exporter with double-glycine peptidase domain
MQLTQRPLFYWVKNRYLGLQLFLLLVIVVSLFFRVYPLEMQRKIINIAINLKMVDKLYLYCALYMGAVLIAGLLKFFTNTLQEIIGQKIMIGMRQELYQHMLQLPLTFFHRTQTGTITAVMTSELNTIASFLGGAIAVPISSVLTFAVFLGFMIYLNPLLGLLSLGIYPAELIVIPFLQRWYNRYNHTRVATTRQMASLVNESVSGIHEVQGNGSFLLEQKKLDRLINRLYELIFKLSILKYGIKFSNNLFQSFGPFLLFLVGGYLAIKGEFTIGALVAFLSAYEKVYDPWKEVVDYFQEYQDAQVRYKQIMELFDHQPEFLLEAPEKKPRHFAGTLELSNVGYQVNDNIRLLEDISFRLPAGRHLALVGFSGSGKSTLALLLSRLYRHTEGSITIDGHDIEQLDKTEVVANISSVAQEPFIFTGTVRDNLLYSWQALHLTQDSKELPSQEEIVEIIRGVGLLEDVIRWGLRSTILPQRAEPMVPSFLRMRSIIRETMREEFSQGVEFYDATKFLNYSSLAVNIIFGSYGISFTTKKLLGHRAFRRFLVEEELEGPLTEFGLRIAKATIALLADFRGDDFFFQGSPMKPAQLSQYEDLVKKTAQKSLHKLPARERDRFLLLGLKFTPGLHKITTISDQLEGAVLRARRRFLKEVVGIDIESCTDGTLQTDIAPYQAGTTGKTEGPQFTPFCINHYLTSHTLLNNILFGTVIDRDLIRERLGSVVQQEFERNGLVDDIVEIGLDFHVGSKGDNLSGGQKQKLALARALLKKSPILILDEATSGLDNTSQTRVQHYISSKLRGTTTLVAVVHRLDMISEYDHILVLKDGKIVESGTYDDLIEQKGPLYELANDNR